MRIPDDQLSSSTPGDPLQVVLIGLGMGADPHLHAMAALPDKVRLRGVLTRSKVSAEAALRKLPPGIDASSCHCYRSIDELLADSAIDMVILATPPNARLALVDALASAGLPLLMEKPLERNQPAATQIIERCESAGIVHGVVFQHRVRPASIHLLEHVRQGRFGQLGLVEVLVPWWRSQAYYDEPGRGSHDRDGGGVLITQAIHTLDLMLQLTGPVQEVQASCRTSRFHRMEAEDHVTAGLRFSNGAFGSLIASTASFPGRSESITLHFDDAVACLQRGTVQIDWRNGQSETFGAEAASGSGADPMAFSAQGHRDILDDFVDAVRKQRQPLATGRQALQVQALIDAMLASSTQGQRVAVAETATR